MSQWIVSEKIHIVNVEFRYFIFEKVLKTIYYFVKKETMTGNLSNALKFQHSNFQLVPLVAHIFQEIKNFAISQN